METATVYAAGCGTYGELAVSWVIASVSNEFRGYQPAEREMSRSQIFFV